jgi:hypothetical protein
MLSLIKKLFGAKPTTQLEVEVRAEAAPYKVPEPAATTPIPLVIPVAGLMLPVEGAGEVAVPAKKAKKPAVPKADKPATAKKPRTPKAK